MSDALRIIEEALHEKTRAYISTCPVSTILACQRDAEVRDSINSAILAAPDGMPIVWLGRMAGHSNIRRVYGPDLLLEICKISEEKGYKNYFYGSTPETINKLNRKLAEKFPRLIIAGTFSPPFRELTKEEDKAIINKINSSAPDIIWVGLGSPKQDIWMHQHRNIIDAPIMIAVGAAFDFVSGSKPQAPRWIQRCGLEWSFRLFNEPKRLWKRYLIGNSLFILLLSLNQIRKLKEDLMKDKIIFPAATITVFILMVFIMLSLGSLSSDIKDLGQKVYLLTNKINSKDMLMFEQKITELKKNIYELESKYKGSKQEKFDKDNK